MDNLKTFYSSSKKLRSVAVLLDNDLVKKIMEILWKKGSTYVGDICDYTEKSQPYISNKLGLLKEYGIVTTTKNKTYVYYSINKDMIEHIISFTHSLKEELTPA